MLRQVLDVKLDAYGYPGHAITIWPNPPKPILDEFMGRSLSGSTTLMLERGLLVGSTFTAEDGAAVPLTDLPWDVLDAAYAALVVEVTRRRELILKPPTSAEKG